MILSDKRRNETLTGVGKRFCLLITEAEAGCAQGKCKT